MTVLTWCRQIKCLLLICIFVWGAGAQNALQADVSVDEAQQAMRRATDYFTTQVSTEGGTDPSWSKDGAEMFYVQIPSSETTTFNAVKVRVDSTNGELRLGELRQLFSGPFWWGGFPSRNHYDVGPDGRFLVRKRDQKDFRPRLLEAMAPTRIELVQTWFEELRAKLPVE